MTLVSPSQSNPNDEITAAAINGPVNQIAAVINGNIDSTNIASVSGAKIQAGTVAATAMDTNSNPETRMSESLGSFVATGAVWSISSGLVGTMTSGVVYIGGVRVPVNAVATKSFTASKDTYVSVSNTGLVSYSEVANNAAAPSLPANSIWLAIVVTGASAITAAKDIRRLGAFGPTATISGTGNTNQFTTTEVEISGGGINQPYVSTASPSSGFLIIGQVAIQSTDTSLPDVFVRLKLDGVIVAQTVFTVRNQFAGGAAALVGTVTGITAGNHQFKLFGQTSAGNGLVRMDYTNIKIIPMNS